MNKNNKQLIYILSGEHSGDLHGANLIKELTLQSKNTLIFRGLGGPLMQSEGLTSIESFNKLSVMGFVEVLKKLSFFIKLKQKIIDDIVACKPVKIILIDYPGFNLKIAKAIKQKIKTKIFYYISPQIWAWKEGRINTIKEYVDEMIVLFPFEVIWYKQRHVNVNYFGHPLIDLYNSKKLSSQNISEITVGVFPGSRKQEIDKHIPILNKTIQLLRNKLKNVRFVVGVNKELKHDFTNVLNLQSNDLILENNAFNIFNQCQVAIVASGTATLECAITQTPCVVIYKTSFLSWLLTSWFVKIKFASIVNILGNKFIFKEYLQKRCRPHLIAKQVIQLINSDNKQLGEDLKIIINELGNGCAYKQTGDFILND